MKIKKKLISTICISVAFVCLFSQTLMAAATSSPANNLTKDSAKLSATVYGKTTGNEVTGVSLDKKSMIVVVGTKFDLKATITPSKATNKNVTWFSSNTAAVKVNDKGSVTAVKIGSAKICVVTKDGEKVASCMVVVVPKTVAVSSVTLNKKTTEIKVNKSLRLAATVKPDNATDISVKWSSSNPSIATVNATGLVTGKKAGKATITVATNSGKKVSTCVVTVTK